MDTERRTHDGHENATTGGLNRRDLIRRGAVIGGAAAWTLPTVQSIGMRAAFAGTPPPADRDCTGFAYDLEIEASGLVTGFAGPVRESTKDQHHPEDCFSQISVGLPDHPDLVTADTFCVENDFETSPCDTRAEWENATVDLTSLISGAPVLSVSVLRATAEAECDAEPKGDSHIVALELGGESVTVSGDPNQTVDTNALLDGLLDPLVRVTLVINEQTPIPGGIAVNAVRLTVQLLNLLGEPVQTVEVILAHAEADVHNC